MNERSVKVYFDRVNLFRSQGAPTFQLIRALHSACRHLSALSRTAATCGHSMVNLKPARSERAAERRGGGTFRPSWQVRRGFEAAHAPVSCRQPAPIVGGSGRRNKKSVPGHHYRYCSVLGVGTDADACGAPVRFLTPVGVPDARAAAAQASTGRPPTRPCQPSRIA